jgi:hypothetical protein
MFCPNCRSEYRPGFYRCSDCDVDLVAHLPAEPRADPPENNLVKVFETRDTGVAGVVASFLIANSIEYFATNSGQYVNKDVEFWVAKEDENAARDSIRAATASEKEVAAGFAEATTGLHVGVWHYSAETGGRTEEIEAPTWEKVEEEIRSMHPIDKPVVHITSGNATETDAFGITGGDGVYHLGFSGGDGDWHKAVNPDRGNAELGAWTSVPGFTTQERFTWSTEDALRIARFFWEKQKPSPDVEWS